METFDIIMIVVGFTATVLFGIGAYKDAQECIKALNNKNLKISNK